MLLLFCPPPLEIQLIYIPCKRTLTTVVLLFIIISISMSPPRPTPITRSPLTSNYRPFVQSNTLCILVSVVNPVAFWNAFILSKLWRAPGQRPHFFLRLNSCGCGFRPAHPVIRGWHEGVRPRPSRKVPVNFPKLRLVRETRRRHRRLEGQQMICCHKRLIFSLSLSFFYFELINNSVKYQFLQSVRFFVNSFYQ